MDAKTTLTQIADAFEIAYFDRFPEVGLLWGKTDVPLDRFKDHSFQADQHWQEAEDAFLSQLEQINVNDLKGTPQYQTYHILKQKLESNRAMRISKDVLWSVDPMRGWPNLLGMIAQKQPVGTAENREKALKRWRSFDQVAQDEIDNLTQGLKEGYTAPKPAVERVIQQLTLILEAPIEQSPYYDFALRDDDDAFKRECATIIAHIIHPALKRYADFLQTTYLLKARGSIGLLALPDGKRCYQAKIHSNTTLDISPEEIHQFGLTHMERLYEEVGAIGQSEFGVKDMSEVFRLAKEKTQHVFKTEQDMLDYNQAALKKAMAKAPEWFKNIPKAPATVKPYPLYRAKTGAPGEYHPPSDDGLRPGIFYINTFEPENKSSLDQEATLFHELIPGHHFQVSIAKEDKTHHSLDFFLLNWGYVEGWALYSERVADEMALYQDNLSRLGMLSNEALRTARLVIDPGIHAMGWTRAQAVDYLTKHTALESHIIESEVDRYIIMPGQAVTYMLGKREIDTLRQQAVQQQGANFDIKEFHHQVLKNGAVTLPMLRMQIEEWLHRD